MKITYRIEQYDVDDFIIVITSPEYLAGLHTRIQTPHFLLSELQQHIKTNLNQTIRRFCIKHKQYADILRDETFEFEPDEYDRYEEHDNSCWFYTGKFIDDTRPELSDEEKDEISYENLIRYDSAYSPSPDFSAKLIVATQWLKNRPGGVIKIQSLEPHKAIDVYRVHASFGVSFPIIYNWVKHQNSFAPNKGNTHGTQTVFPRHIKKENGEIRFPISELQKYLNILYKRGYSSKHPSEKHKKAYDEIKEHLINYSKTHTPRRFLEKHEL